MKFGDQIGEALLGFPKGLGTGGLGSKVAVLAKPLGAFDQNECKGSLLVLGGPLKQAKPLGAFDKSGPKQLRNTSKTDKSHHYFCNLVFRS